MYECRIAEKLTELRAAKGVTQGDVAQGLSVSNKTVSKWETGASLPDLSMLVEISKYYGVTTDELLGFSAGKKSSTKEEVRASFAGLDGRESVLKAFDAVRAIIPSLYGRLAKRGDSYDKESIFPCEISAFSRSNISLYEFFEFVSSSDDVNVAVMLLRNKSNFAWMNDPSKQKEITRLFRFLSNEDALSVLYFVHSASCSESFTSDYVAMNTDVDESRVSVILDEFCRVGDCRCVTAHLSEGDVKVYECYGDGLMLALISLAFEKMCGRAAYDYHLHGKCKMIGGK